MISNKCKYAIKAILYIADRAEENRPVLSSEIASNQNIPKKFLEAILRELRNNMILSSRRGRSGGYSLLKDPKEICLTDIIRIMDGPIAMLPCVSLNYYSSCEQCDEANCRIKSVFEKVRDSTLEVLNGTTIDTLSHL